MADMLLIMKVYPEEPGMEHAIEEKLKKLKHGRVQETRIEPIAFGLCLVKMAVIVPDEAGSVEAVEKDIKGMAGVKDVEVEGMTLL